MNRHNQHFSTWFSFQFIEIAMRILIHMNMMCCIVLRVVLALPINGIEICSMTSSFCLFSVRLSNDIR